jgi:hypothetical protein
MTPTPRRVPSPTHLGAGASFLTRSLAILVAVAALSTALAGAASGAMVRPSADPTIWSNGDVTCMFAPDHPAVTISPSGTTNSGLYVGFFEFDELAGLTGSPVANASTFGPAWALLNESTPGQLALAYVAHLPVHATADGASVGTVSVTVVIAAAYEPTSDAVGSVVSIHLLVMNWPWLHAQDTLAIRAPLWPADTGTEHLAISPDAPTRVESVSSSSGATVEDLMWDPTGLSASNGSANRTVPVTTNSTFGPMYTTLTWTFGSGAQGAQKLSFDSSVSVVLPAKVLGIPLYDYVLAAGAAGMVSVVGLIGLRHVRGRPSSLEFVEEPP